MDFVLSFVILLIFQVLSTILQRPHKFNNQPVEVKPYYSCLENRLPYNEDIDASGHQRHS